jgi:Fe-S-cluster-containing hydrogenase component 2
MDKFLMFNPELCIGCRICELICSLTKFGECNPKKSMIRVLRNEELNVNIITLRIACDLCNGKEMCVHFCPTKAITFEGRDKAVLSRKRMKIGKHPAPIVS